MDWVDVIDFVETQKRKEDLKIIDQQFNKGNLITCLKNFNILLQSSLITVMLNKIDSGKIALLEAQLKNQEEINMRLVARVKMLEFALRQER